MTKQDSLIKTAAVRDSIVELARSQLGAHYLMGAAGASPGNEDGTWYKKGEVDLHANDPKGCPPILYAATRSGKETWVCGGRYSQSEVQQREQGDPSSASHTSRHWLFKWERPLRVAGSKDSVFGESCVEVRHFDCVHFVNWVLCHVQPNVQYDIDTWMTKRVEPIGSAEVVAGDLLAHGTSHIGIATGPAYVVHASDTQWGVVETKIAEGKWDRFGRLKETFWLRYRLTTDEVEGDAMVISVR